EEKKPAPKKEDKDSGTVVGNMPTSEEELVEHVTTGLARGAPADRVRAAPAVRALARKLDVDLGSIKGTGKGGLITIDDVMGSTSRLADPQAVAVAGTRAVLESGATRTQPPAAGAAQEQEEQLRGLRRGMAHSMAVSRDTVASCTLFDDADLHAWIRKTDY